VNIVRDDKLIGRNRKIAQFTMLGGLLVLGGGMFISFRYPEQVGISLGALLIGFLLSQVGIYFSNRWGRRPRPDEMLDQALKGLDSKYTLYHYASPVQHLLVGPAGLWVLLPYHQRGTISFKKGRWVQKGGPWYYGYLKLFAQESLGRPDVELSGELDGLKRFLGQHLPDGAVPELQAALVFMHPEAVIDIPEDENPPAETIPLSKLKEAMRKIAKNKPLSNEKARLIQDALLANKA
jgi:hypothetical protein